MTSIYAELKKSLQQMREVGFVNASLLEIQRDGTDKGTTWPTMVVVYDASMGRAAPNDLECTLEVWINAIPIHYVAKLAFGFGHQKVSVFLDQGAFTPEIANILNGYGIGVGTLFGNVQESRFPAAWAIADCCCGKVVFAKDGDDEDSLRIILLRNAGLPDACILFEGRTAFMNVAKLLHFV